MHPPVPASIPDSFTVDFETKQREICTGCRSELKLTAEVVLRSGARRSKPMLQHRFQVSKIQIPCVKHRHVIVPRDKRVASFGMLP